MLKGFLSRYFILYFLKIKNTAVHRRYVSRMCTCMSIEKKLSVEVNSKGYASLTLLPKSAFILLFKINIINNGIYSETLAHSL